MLAQKIKMADQWTTPKSSLPPHLRPSSRVTPTLALSEGPLTPSPNIKPRISYHIEDAPIRRVQLEESSVQDSDKSNVEIIKLQCQVEQLTRKYN